MRKEVQETQYGILLTDGSIKRQPSRHGAEDRASFINKALREAGSPERVIPVTRTAIIIIQETGTWRAVRTP